MRLLLALSLLILQSASVQAIWMPLSSSLPRAGDLAILEDTGSRTTLSLTLSGYESEEINIDGTRCVRITMPSTAPTLEKGEPELPIWTGSIIIPDRGSASMRVVESQWEELPSLPVVPSKGNLYRTIDPATVPYEFGVSYGRDTWFPGPEVRLSEPFILRDYRGVTVIVHPVQYNGARGVLRVLRRLVVEVETAGSGGVNELERRSLVAAREFSAIYEGMFVNLRSQRRTLNERAGKMLIIAADTYHDGMADLVSWKREKGIDTKIVAYSAIGGTGATAVKNYIQNEYNAGGLVFVLLVGDLAHIPTQTYSGGEADPMYSLVAGSDVYPDIFVSRFSAQTVADVSTQVLRSVEYERSPTAATAWYHKATGIASNQSNGGLIDYEWMNGFRTKLLNYHYTEMDQIYDPSASASQVTTALNAGRSLVLYMGHGSETSWGTTGFSNTNINALSNYWMLPVIHSVACVNGDFSTTTCFAEAWLRAQNGGEPRGALATYMSSINQSWDPPQIAQQGFVDSLVNNRYNTVGGTLFIGSVRMLEYYSGGSAGTEMFNTWHIFGDCSVQMRTDSPAFMAATYPSTVPLGTSSISVTVAGLEGALVGISSEGQFLGSGYTNASGAVTVMLTEPLDTPGTVKLTITAYNKTPIQADIEVISTSGPHVVYAGSTILGDGQADVGETVLVDIELENVGNATAYAVQATLSTVNAQITVTVPTQSYGDMGAGATALPAAPFQFYVGSLPDGTVVPFDVAITSGMDSWEGSFDITVHASPEIGVTPTVVEEWAGVGETAQRAVMVSNSGTGDLTYTVGVMTDSRQGTAVPFLELGKGEPDPRVGETPARGSGGPDGYGYRWIDSDEPGGPAFSWLDISSTGTSPGSGDDSNYGPFNLGFTFPFYGTDYTQVRICTNGWLSFTSTSTAYTNQGIPSTSEPNCLIAPFWDDLSPNYGGSVRYQSDAGNGRFIAQWTEVPRWTSTGGTGSYTFQVIVYADGRIVYQYNTLVGDLESCTVGIENQGGTDGVQVVSNAAYLHNGLAIQISTVQPWLTVAPVGGTVVPGSSAELTATMDAADLGAGTYTGTITITSNDADESSIEIPVTFHVGALMPPELTVAPVGSEVQLTWTEVTAATAYWVYGASNEAYFVPGMGPGYAHRVAVLPSGTTSWSSAAGMGDP
ncbi:hypothetical protein JXA88_02455, partial [Candidatus Fermentibacteria bacterium]|nr:hypothetical protein [Candidatus Fermentibacteria bacterium]